MNPPNTVLLQRAAALRDHAARLARDARDYCTLYDAEWSDYYTACYLQLLAQEASAKARLAYDSALELSESYV
jgi:hypothetical protein